jgi:hypothetical protein
MSDGARLLMQFGIAGLLTAVVLRIQFGPIKDDQQYGRWAVEGGYGCAIVGVVLLVAGGLVWLL